MGNTKVLYPSQFCHQNHMLGSVQDSNHDSVVRIPECLSKQSNVIYSAQSLPCQECNNLLELDNKVHLKW